MENITYDVRIWKTEVYKGTKVTTYTVRWKIGDRAWKQPFRAKAQADSFEAELHAAARKGEAFDTTTGRPVSWGRATNNMSWYDFCVSYVDMKWKHSAAHRRANIAWALVTVMPAMLATDRGKPDDKAMRWPAAVGLQHEKARRPAREDAAAHPQVAVSQHQTGFCARRPGRDACTFSTPPRPCSTATRHRRGLPGATAPSWTTRWNTRLNCGLLTRNPIKAIKWKAPKTTQEVDRRCVVNHAQARRLLDAVRDQSPSGPRLVAFFAVIYYAALRPEEAVNLREDNITLPPLVRNDATRQMGGTRRRLGRAAVLARPHPRSAPNGPMTAAAANTGTSSPAPQGNGGEYRSPRR